MANCESRNLISTVIDIKCLARWEECVNITGDYDKKNNESPTQQMSHI